MSTTLKIGPNEWFKSLQHAVDFLAENDPPSNANPSIIKVGAGECVGDAIIPAYVSVEGEAWQGSILRGVITIAPGATVKNLKILGNVVMRCGNTVYAELGGVVVVNFDTTAPAVRVTTQPGATSGVGALIWGKAVIGSWGPHAVLVDARLEGGSQWLPMVEHVFDNVNFEMYGNAGVSGVRFATGALFCRMINCTYQVSHLSAPTSVGLESVGVNVASMGDVFEDGMWDAPAGAKYVKVDGGPGQFKATVRLSKPAGHFLGASHISLVNGGTYSIF